MMYRLIYIDSAAALQAMEWYSPAHLDRLMDIRDELTRAGWACWIEEQANDQ